MHSLLLWSLFIFVSISQCSCECDEKNPADFQECPVLFYNLLEKALLRNDSDNLFQLRQVFFQENGISPPSVDFFVTIAADVAPGLVPCDYNSQLAFDRTGYAAYIDLEWTKSTPDQATADKLVLGGTLSIAIGLVTTSLKSCPGVTDNTEVNIKLHLGTLPCNPSCETLGDTVSLLFSWAEAYARADGRPTTWDKSDKGLILGYSPTFQCPSWQLNSGVIIRLLLTGFVFLNILVMLLMVKFMPQFYQKLSQHINHGPDTSVNLYHIFWASVFVLAVFNVLDIAVTALVTAVYSQVDVIIDIISASKLVITGLVFLVELPAAFLICRHYNNYSIPIPSQVLSCCCFCCCCSRNLKSKAVQTLGLWTIMFFVQNITMSIIPVMVSLIFHPAQTLSVVALFVSSIFSLIMFVAHLFQLRSRKCHTILFQSVAFLLLLGLVFVIVITYLYLLSSGENFRGAQGFLLSLVPSAILSGIGWYVKKKFLKTPRNLASATEDERSNVENASLMAEPNNQEPTEDTPLIQ